eukprot:3521347-Amphidinium_carterae.3
MIMDVIRRLAAPDAQGICPDAIVQCGTNLSMIAIADKLETELGIPIIPINAATLWLLDSTPKGPTLEKRKQRLIKVYLYDHCKQFRTLGVPSRLGQ